MSDPADRLPNSSQPQPIPPDSADAPKLTPKPVTKPLILSITPPAAANPSSPTGLPETPAPSAKPQTTSDPKATKATSQPKSFSSDDFAQALAAHSFEFRQGQVVTGRVVEHDPKGAYVDIGGKSPGFLPLEEAILGGADHLEQALPKGTKRDFVILREADADGAVTLSIRSLLMKQAWQNLHQFQQNNQVFNCKILDLNSGGLVVSAQGWRGFIPRSHLNIQVEDLDQVKGTSLPVVILELDQERHKIVLSNRLAVRSSAMAQFQKGQLVNGTIASVRSFGAFVDLGGCSALLHVKEVSQKYISNIESVFPVGSEIRAVVIEVDESRQRLALSTKILELHNGEILEHAAEVFAEAEARLEKNINQLWEI
ncbi:MAG: S1 RNA-binding domain-containing protein [Pseudanabaenaceae cyanobacterium bins.68]|nr:S1 RNA-binding domain-containing protein [Pseudanabaenaceae cyanobacterium bins.68]